MVEPVKQNEMVKYQPDAPVGTAGTLKALLASPSVLAGLGRLVPKNLNADRLGQIVLLAGSRQPLLYQCTQASLLRAVMNAAELGLSCSGTLARGYLVPYWSGKLRAYEAQFIPGYGGLIDIICEPGGVVSHITAELVYGEDEFEVRMGSENKIHHVINPRALRDKADLVGGYLIAWIRGGGEFVRYMPMSEILRHRDKTASKNKAGEIVGPWVTDFAAMCRKTLVRASAQYLPLSKEQQEKIELTDEPIDYSVGDTTSISLEPTQGREKWGFDLPKETQEPPEEAGAPQQESVFPSESAKSADTPPPTSMPEQEHNQFLIRCGWKGKVKMAGSTAQVIQDEHLKRWQTDGFAGIPVEMGPEYGVWLNETLYTFLENDERLPRIREKE